MNEFSLIWDNLWGHKSKNKRENAFSATPTIICLVVDCLGTPVFVFCHAKSTRKMVCVNKSSPPPHMDRIIDRVDTTVCVLVYHCLVDSAIGLWILHVAGLLPVGRRVSLYLVGTIHTVHVSMGNTDCQYWRAPKCALPNDGTSGAWFWANACVATRLAYQGSQDRRLYSPETERHPCHT